MNSSNAALSYLNGALDIYLSNLIDETELSKQEIIDTIFLPVIVNKLREYNVKLITSKELESVCKTIDELEVSDTIKQVLQDYTNQIKQIMNT